MRRTTAASWSSSTHNFMRRSLATRTRRVHRDRVAMHVLRVLREARETSSARSVERDLRTHLSHHHRAPISRAKLVPCAYVFVFVFARSCLPVTHTSRAVLERDLALSFIEY